MSGLDVFECYVAFGGVIILVAIVGIVVGFIVWYFMNTNKKHKGPA